MAAGPIVMNAIASAIQDTLGKDMGFVVLVFRHGEGERGVNYASNSNREDVIKFLREAAEQLEQGKSGKMKEI